MTDTRGTIGLRFSTSFRIGVGAAVGANIVAGVSTNTEIKSGTEHNNRVTIEGGKLVGGGVSGALDEKGQLQVDKDVNARGGLEAGGAVSLDLTGSYTFAINPFGNKVESGEVQPPPPPQPCIHGPNTTCSK